MHDWWRWSLTRGLTRLRGGGRVAVLWSLRITVAAVASYVVGTLLFPGTQPLLAPLSRLQRVGTLRRPLRVVYDNLKSVVLHHIGSTVQFNPHFLPFAGHYLFEPLAARCATLNSKGGSSTGCASSVSRFTTVEAFETWTT